LLNVIALGRVPWVSFAPKGRRSAPAGAGHLDAVQGRVVTCAIGCALHGWLQQRGKKGGPCKAHALTSITCFAFGSPCHHHRCRDVTADACQWPGPPGRPLPSQPAGPSRPALRVVGVGWLGVLLHQLHLQRLHHRNVQPARLQAGSRTMRGVSRDVPVDGRAVREGVGADGAGEWLSNVGSATMRLRIICVCEMVRSAPRPARWAASDLSTPNTRAQPARALPMARMLMVLLMQGSSASTPPARLTLSCWHA